MSPSDIASCPFCTPDADRVFLRNEEVLGLWDRFPVSPGHALVVPRRHVADWFDATADEKTALLEGVDVAKAEIERQHRPDGYNIGINRGAAAGQTIFHLHVHVIPRYSGDVEDPRGGVRSVIPIKGNYLAEAREFNDASAVRASLLVAGGKTDPLLPQLKVEIARASSLDVAVAFTLWSGVDALWEQFQDLLDRGGRLRFLTGDYLDSTDPDALLRLLDLEGTTQGTLERRVYQTHASDVGALTTSFHPKAYIISYRDGRGIGFVGSSNLSASALGSGIEWNYRVVSARDEAGFRDVGCAFSRLFTDPHTTELTPEWIAAYRTRRRAPRPRPDAEMVREEKPDPPLILPEPHTIQREALVALERARANGARAGLVVLATGLGKTWLSAFDSTEFQQVLFVAHREEILGQAMRTYRRVRPSEYLGHFNGTEKHFGASVVFASVQTLGKRAHLEAFAPEHFDYLVMDEFHHASAATYRKILDHFKPKFLLGLTATPERADGADLLSLCHHNLVYRCDLAEGIRRSLLCPFQYFGVPDEVDYRQIPWRSTRFDEEALSLAVATQSRAQNAQEQLERRGGTRTLAFCVSQRHADFMAAFFVQRGKRAVAVHTGPNTAPRVESLERLSRGELDVVCAVDMFNEGVDLPELDTILMLRPTESRVLWLQQFGRGLRKGRADKRLVVIDYIGNHRTFLLKPRALFELPPGDNAIQNMLVQLEAGTAELPPGCEVTYDLEAVDILRGLLRITPDPAADMRTYVLDFAEQCGIRPTAVEAFRDGHRLGNIRPDFGSWFAFLDNCRLLTDAERLAWQCTDEFLRMLEVTAMARSYKMLVLLAMVDAEQLPGRLQVGELAQRVRVVLDRMPYLREEFGDALASDRKLIAHLRKNPIAAWIGARRADGTPWFERDRNVFSCSIEVPEPSQSVFHELVRELADLRLAEYADR